METQEGATGPNVGQVYENGSSNANGADDPMQGPVGAEYGTPDIPQEYVAQIEEAKRKFLEEADDLPRWTVTKKKGPIQGYTRSDGGLTSVMGVGRVHYNPRALWEIIIDPALKKHYDKQLDSGRSAKRINKQTSIDHLVYKAVWPTAARDFVSLVHWQVDESGTIYIIAFETQCPEVPEKPRIVRGKCILAGWRIIPKDNYNSSDVTFMVMSDLGGNIPAFVVAKASETQPFLINGIIDMLHKDKDLVARSIAAGPLTNATKAEEDKSRVSMLRSSVAEVQPAGSINPFGDFSIPEEYAAATDQVLEWCLQNADSGDWKHVGEKQGIKADAKTDGVFTCARGKAMIPYSANKIFGLIFDVDVAKMLDPTLDSIRVVKKIDFHNGIEHRVYKAIWPVSARDLAHFAHWRVLPNGDIWIMGYSFETPLIPPSNGVVRAEVTGGYRLRPSDDYSTTEMTYLIRMDLKGNIPRFALNKVTQEQPYQLVQLVKILRTWSAPADLPRKIKNGGSQSRPPRFRAESAPRSHTEPRQAAIVRENVPVMENLDDSGSPIYAYGLLVIPLVVSLTLGSLWALACMLVVGHVVVSLSIGKGQRGGSQNPLASATLGSWACQKKLRCAITVDLKFAKEYLQQRLEKKGSALALRHLVIKALAKALQSAPQTDGRAVMGKFIANKGTSEISCLAIAGGDAATIDKCVGRAIRVTDATDSSLETIAEQLRDGAGSYSLDNSKLPGLVERLPSILSTPLLYMVGYVAGTVGVSIPFLGVERFPLGFIMVADASRMCAESVMATAYNWVDIPITLTMGSETPRTFVDDKKRLRLHSSMTFQLEVDHRIIGDDFDHFLETFKEIMSNPVTEL